MAYQRNGHWYRSMREGRHVRTEYLGRVGGPGDEAAALCSEEAEERRAARRRVCELLAREREQDRFSDVLAALGRALIAVQLIEEGYHQHKGTWRRRGRR